MKALTLTQPWASLVALGWKTVETRGWSTAHRGALAIHAARGFPLPARRFAETERALGRIPERLPLGAVVCIVHLARVERTEEIAPRLSGLERHLGDYRPGRFGWVLDMEFVLPEPVPARGALGLWDWPHVEPLARFGAAFGPIPEPLRTQLELGETPEG